MKHTRIVFPLALAAAILLTRFEAQQDCSPPNPNILKKR